MTRLVESTSLKHSRLHFLHQALIHFCHFLSCFFFSLCSVNTSKIVIFFFSLHITTRHFERMRHMPGMFSSLRLKDIEGNSFTTSFTIFHTPCASIHVLYLCSAALYTTHVSTEELWPCVMVYITFAGFRLSPNKPAHLSASLLIPCCCLSPPSSPRGQPLCVYYYFNYSGSNSKTLSMCTGHPPTTMYSVDTVINVRKWNPVKPDTIRKLQS